MALNVSSQPITAASYLTFPVGWLEKTGYTSVEPIFMCPLLTLYVTMAMRAPCWAGGTWMVTLCEYVRVVEWDQPKLDCKFSGPSWRPTLRPGLHVSEVEIDPEISLSMAAVPL